MKSSIALFLQGAVGLIGLGIMSFLLWEPHLEGRNEHVTSLVEIYFKDPFLLYVYAGSIPFFVAVYRALGMLGEVRRNGRFSQATVDAMRAIKRCAFTVIGFVAGGVVIIFVTGDPDDRPAGVFMSLLVTVAAGSTATAAAMLAQKVQKTLGR